MTYMAVTTVETSESSVNNLNVPSEQLKRNIYITGF